MPFAKAGKDRKKAATPAIDAPNAARFLVEGRWGTNKLRTAKATHTNSPKVRDSQRYTDLIAILAYTGKKICDSAIE
jgi:hypothetical protein